MTASAIAFSERLVESATAGMELLTVHLGVELGLYRALRDLGDATEAELAKTTGIAPRYAREWLEQQTAAGIVGCADPAAPAESRRYSLDDAHAEVLLDADGPLFTAGITGLFAGVAQVTHLLPEAFRTGGGVPYPAYGPATRNGIADMNRPGFLHALATEWLPALGVPAPARVLDLGCGLGVSTLALARAYPSAEVIGVDLDRESVLAARARSGAERVTFAQADAATVGAQHGPFDLVTIFEALHDMGDPAGALAAVRGVLAPGGVVFVADEKVADTFAGPADLAERLQYAFSVTHCLPATMAESPVEAAGTALRAPTVARWAQEAGFARCEVLDVPHDFWRFYKIS